MQFYYISYYFNIILVIKLELVLLYAVWPNEYNDTKTLKRKPYSLSSKESYLKDNATITNSG